MSSASDGTPRSHQHQYQYQYHPPRYQHHLNQYQHREEEQQLISAAGFGLQSQPLSTPSYCYYSHYHSSENNNDDNNKDNDSNITGQKAANNSSKNNNKDDNNNNKARWTKRMSMKHDSGKCPRFMHIFGSGVFGSCTAILQAKKFRSRRKADLPAGEKDVPTLTASAATYNANTNATPGGLFHLGTAKKTGLTNCSKVASTKVIRRRAANGGALASGGMALSSNGDISVADAMDEVDIEKICILPERFDRNEWLATHTLALFDHVNALCGTVSEVCTPVTCHVMNYPGSSKVSWVDERGKRHNYSAMRYIDSVMSFCEASRKNQQIFPTKFGMTFSADFDAQCRRMIRMLWHCCGHLYHKHWEHICMLNLRSQYALVLTHLATIARLFDMLDAKEMLSIRTTVQAVRPPVLYVEADSSSAVENDEQQQQKPQQQQRPAKRLNSCTVDDDESDGGAGTTTKPFGGATKATKAPLKMPSPSWLGAGPLAHLFSGVTRSTQSQENSNTTTTPAGHQWSLDIYNNNSRPQQQSTTTAAAAAASQGRVFAAPMAMKSGSWGGHSAIFKLPDGSSSSTAAANILEHNTGATTTRSFKNFVQTY